MPSKYNVLPRALAAGLLAAAGAWAGEKIRIVSEWGELTAVLEDNASTQALLGMLPLELPMRDHLRQEKTGRLRTPLPEQPRTVDFANGDLGLWGNDAFVIYYANGSVPSPGIITLGRIEGGAKLYDRPGPVTVRIERTR
jgi:hypothetical protein